MNQLRLESRKCNKVLSESYYPIHWIETSKSILFIYICMGPWSIQLLNFCHFLSDQNLSPRKGTFSLSLKTKSSLNATNLRDSCEIKDWWLNVDKKIQLSPEGQEAMQMAQRNVTSGIKGCTAVCGRRYTLLSKCNSLALKCRPPISKELVGTNDYTL